MIHHCPVKFHWMVDHASDGFLVIDQHSRIRYANPAAMKRLQIDCFLDEDFWDVAGRNARIVGQDTTIDSPIYLVRPESVDSQGIWHRVDRIHVPNDPSQDRVIRLVDVTAERQRRQALWAHRSTKEHKIRISNGHAMQQMQMCEPGRGSRSDEWLPVFRSWVQKLAPAGSTYSILWIPPEATLAISYESFALIATELIDYVRLNSQTNSPGANFFIEGTPFDTLAIRVRMTPKTMDFNQIEQTLTPVYPRPYREDDDNWLAEAASLLWNIGGECHIRPNHDKQIIELDFSIPLQTSGSRCSSTAGIFADGDSLIGG